MAGKFSVQWHDHEREPKVPFNRRWPEGVPVDATDGQLPACQTDLPWPAKRCGWWEIRCANCKASIAITTAGRVDDPRSVRIPCKPQGNA